MTAARARRAGGFTLLELIIAMTVLALVAGICYAAFHLGIRAVERGEVAVVTAQRLRVATDVLIRQVKSAALNPALVEGDTYPFFYGSSDTMRFITDAGQLAGGGRSRVTYHFEADPPRLILEESAYFDADSLGRGTPDAAEARTAVLLDGFKTMTFQYLLDDGGETEWRNSWDYTELEVMPVAVRIIIEGLPGLEEDVWGQEIPIMVAAYGEGAECGDDSTCEVQDCEAFETTTGGGESDGKSSSTKPGGKTTGGKDEDADNEDDE